jgi:hypothetical protein
MTIICSENAVRSVLGKLPSPDHPIVRKGLNARIFLGSHKKGSIEVSGPCNKAMATLLYFGPTILEM